MSQLVWLVTGCSSGFGEQFVHTILARGDRVIATSRNLQQIEALQNIGASAIELDISSSQENIDEIISRAISIYGRIDVLINNAGFVSIGTWEDLKYEDFLAQFNTNVFGTIKVTKSVLPHLRERRQGTLTFISSLSGWIGHPGVGAYAGSKFALEGVVESLREEVEHLGIKVLLVEPGRFCTKLLSTRNMKAVASSIDDYKDFSGNLLAGIAGEDQTQPGDPSKLASIVVDVIRQEGVAQDREMPFRLPLGLDVYDDMKAKCEETLKMLEDWESVIRSTDREDKS